MKKLKFISTRVILVWIVFFAFSTLQIGLKIVLFLQGEERGLHVVLSILVLAILSVVSYFWIYKPYCKAERMITRFLDSYDLSDFGNSTMAVLTPSTQKVIRRTDEIVHAPEIFEVNKRQAQYLALQNQINPHFLYNTLESIRSEAIIAGLDSVADMTESLATFFRYTISKVENLVSVEEELENCKTYFHIQKYRFGNRLELDIHYDEDDFDLIRHYRIPKLTLQPILENSIIHGTELKLGTSHLTIDFSSTGKRVIIRISDDGVGMDEATLNRLNSKLKGAKTLHEENAKGGIALANVNNRIHLLFGEEYGMHVYSTPGRGTDVEISIPAIISDREVKNRGVLT